MKAIVTLAAAAVAAGALLGGTAQAAPDPYRRGPSSHSSPRRCRPPAADAHRGDITEHAQESLGSYRDAVAAGAADLSADIRFTADDVPVLVHDADYSAYGSAELIADQPWSYGRALRAPNGDRMMKLRRFIAFLGRHPDEHGNIELKVAPTPDEWASMNTYLKPAPADFTLEAFDTGRLLPTLDQARAFGYRTGAIDMRRKLTPHQMLHYGHTAYVYNGILTPSLLRRYHAAGVSIVYEWTEDTPEQWAAVIPGARVNTDYPGQFLTWYRRHRC